jgi:hypothetical protein
VAEYELEAVELITAEVGVCEGLEGGFISFDQHALMLSTIWCLVRFCEKFISVPPLICWVWKVTVDLKLVTPHLGQHTSPHKSRAPISLH